MLNTTKSEELYKVALDLWPGGVTHRSEHLVLWEETLYLLTMQRVPMFMMWMVISLLTMFVRGPGILGHSHPEVLEEVVKACFDRSYFWCANW